METIACFVTVLWLGFWLALHIWLSLYVGADAKAFRNRQPLFLHSPYLWMLIVLLTGILGAAFYWTVHYSTLRRYESK